VTPPAFVDVITRCLLPEPSARPAVSELIGLFEHGDLLLPDSDSQMFRSYVDSLQVTPSEIPRAPLSYILDEKTLADVYKTESDRGNRYAMLLSGIHRREGRGCTSNKKTALRLFKSAGERGVAEAQLHYGVMSGIKPRNAQVRAESILLIKAAADGGNSEAQFRFAVMVANGQGISHDHETVHRYMRLAIQQQNVEAAATYADMLLKGLLLPKDLELSERYFRAAADLGHSESQFHFAKMLLERHCEDYDTIARYLRFAAANGNVQAAVQLAALFIDGKAEPTCQDELARIYRVAGENGLPLAQRLFAELAIDGAVVLPPDELVKFYQVAADNDVLEAMFAYADMLRNGDGVPKNVPKAIMYFQKAADRGHVKAQYEYGCLLLGRDADGHRKGMRYLRMAADAGYPHAQYQYGLRLKARTENPENPRLAFRFFQEASRYGHVEATHELAELLISGIGCEKDDARGLELMRDAADMGSVTAMYRYASCIRPARPSVALEYFKRSGLMDGNWEAAWILALGDGCPRDDVMAFRYFAKAAEQGSERAMCELAARYREGKGVDPSDEKAAVWMRRAADKRWRPAMTGYAQMLRNGIGVPRDEQMARRYETLADQNDYDYEEDDDDFLAAWRDPTIALMRGPRFARPGGAHMDAYQYPRFTDDGIIMD
jgi:TPR repeat protein